MQQATLDEAKTNLADLVDAAINGDDVFITTDNQQAVKLVPVNKAKRQPQFGSAKGLITMSDDFDEPLEDFKEYME